MNVRLTSGAGTRLRGAGREQFDDSKSKHYQREHARSRAELAGGLVLFGVFSTDQGTSSMKLRSAAALLVAAALTTGAAVAQTAAPPADQQSNPAVKSPQPNSDRPASAATGAASGAGDAAALAEGANSFTEGQARSRLEGAGYSNVTNLTKDDQGIWRGTAQKDGQSVNVGVDFKGNIAPLR